MITHSNFPFHPLPPYNKGKRWPVPSPVGQAEYPDQTRRNPYAENPICPLTRIQAGRRPGRPLHCPGGGDGGPAPPGDGPPHRPGHLLRPDAPGGPVRCFDAGGRLSVPGLWRALQPLCRPGLGRLCLQPSGEYLRQGPDLLLLQHRQVQHRRPGHPDDHRRDQPAKRFSDDPADRHPLPP